MGRCSGGWRRSHSGRGTRRRPCAPGIFVGRDVRVADGTHLSEGVGGYLLLEAEDWDAAIALAARVPAARLGGAVEVRKVEQYW